MLVPQSILRCICFVCGYSKGELVPLGTAFFVGVRVPSSDPEFYTYQAYAVTALHVIADMQKKLIDKRIVLRVNTHDGGFDTVETTFDEWVRPDHANGIIDAAVCFFQHNNRDHFDYDCIHEPYAITPDRFEENSVGIGNDVYFAGMFVNHYGKARNEPIIRSGTLAAIPLEEVNTKAGPASVYLVESRSIGGLSGSPVLVEPETHFMAPSSFEIKAPGSGWYLLGLMQGHWDSAVDVVKADAEAQAILADADLPAQIERLEAVNMGLAMVTPIEKIIPLIRECANIHRP